MIAFSGSEFQEFHRKFVLDNLSNKIVDLKLGNISSTPTELANVEFFWNLNDFKRGVTNLCFQISFLRPLIIISDDHSDRIS